MSQNQGTLDAKNVIVIGKTGLGKSYFLNMLLKEQTPAQGVFTVFDRLDSGTHVCQMEVNRYVQYGPTQNEAITLNLVDTPGLFDTKDNPNIQYHQEFEPQSIQHLKNIQSTVINKPFQNQFNRVILVLSSDQKFDVQHQGMIEICRIMIGQQLKICVAITKCQNLYDRDSEDQEIIGKLRHFASEWKNKLSSYGIEDVFFFSRQPINKYEGKQDDISRFFYDQWIRLYDNLKKSIKSPINNWGDLQDPEKTKIGKYFNYRPGKTDEDIIAGCKNEQEKLEMKMKLQQEEQKRKEAERELKFKQELLEKEKQAQNIINQQKQENDRALREQLENIRKEQEKKQNQMDQQMKKRMEDMERKHQQDHKENQNRLEKQKAESENRTKALEAEVKRRRLQAAQSSSGGGFCLSLDVTINGLDTQLQYHEVFHNKVNVLGNNQSNVCLGLTHLSKTILCNFLKFTFQYEQEVNFIELTAVHLIYCVNKKQYIRAEDIVVEDKLLYYKGQDQCVSVEIIDIQQVEKIGYYCPLTNTGEIFANGILVSCYISPYEFPVTQEFAQFLIKPLIMYRQFTMKYLKDDQQSYNEPQQYLAPFAKILSKIFRVNV